MVYTREAGLEITEVTEPIDFKFVRSSHSAWVELVQKKGGIVMFNVPSPAERQSIRWKINGALRSRGVKASVRLATTPEGHEVYVVTAR
jgi:hypothetical protein